MNAPFLGLALPRSRTNWLSNYLTYGPWTCWHERIPTMRTLDDIKAWLSQDFTGSMETTGAPFWRTAIKIRPDLRILIVRRPVGEVVDSIMKIDMQGVCRFDPVILTKTLTTLNHKLDQIEARAPNVMSVRYDDLANEFTCARVFQYCTGLSHNHGWWSKLDAENLQCGLPSQMRYMFANSAAITRLAATVKRVSLSDMRPKKIVDRDDITIQQESCEVWFRDGKQLFEEHAIQLGEAPTDYLKRNWPVMMTMDSIGAMQIMTARCNGRMVGYYVCYISPATDDASLMSSIQISIFVSKDFAGIGMRLQRAALEALRDKGVGEICFRAGVRADGARMAAVYNRLGAENIGQMYRLDLRRA
jgi:hypothetical protein